MTEGEFTTVRKIRMMLRDPSGVNDLIYVDSLPDNPDTQAAYFCLGTYHRFNSRKKEWEQLLVKLSDNYILETVGDKGITRAAIAMIDFLIMGLQSGAVSFSAGAESVTRHSLQDQINLYKEQKKILMDQLGVSTGRTLKTSRPVIGGVEE